MTALSIIGLYLFVSVCICQAEKQFRSEGYFFVDVTRRLRNNQYRP
jgi:hypothetical protein